MRHRHALALAIAALALALAGCGATPGGSGLPDTGSAPSTPATGTAGGSAEASQPTTFAASAPWPRLKLEQAWSGFAEPLYVTWRAADPEAAYIVEKAGVIHETRGSGVQRFLDITERVNSQASERGLLGLAFPPGRASAERFYVHYTAKNGDVVVSRFRIVDGVGDPGSETQVLRVPHSRHPNHNGGQLAFAPDGTLYVAIGDGGGAGDQDGNARNLGVLLAKILRIDVEGVTAGGKLPKGYAVPPDNPFVKRAGARPEIWAWGLRNPWRFSFDAVTGDLYIADVGQNAVEEIDFQPASSKGGEDYGWSRMEGTREFKGGPAPGLVPPVAEYGRDLGISVTGGYVYRGSRYPALRGVYLFADYGTGRVWGLRREGTEWRVRELAQTRYAVSSFGEDAFRELYLTDIDGGSVYHLTAE